MSTKETKAEVEVAEGPHSSAVFEEEDSADNKQNASYSLDQKADSLDRKNSAQGQFDEFNEGVKFLRWRNRVVLGAVCAFVIVGVVIIMKNVAAGVEEQKKKGSQGTKTDGSNSKGADSSNRNPAHLFEGEVISDSNNNQYSILETYKRDSIHYTQGFYFTDGKILESGGGFGQSSIHYLELDENSKMIRRGKNTDMDSSYFGEGCDIIKTSETTSHIYQLTWLNKKILKFDLNLNLVETLDQPSSMKEGWGITHNPSTPDRMIVSDSSSVMKVLLPSDNFRTISTHDIQYNGNSLGSINELEWAGHHIFANVYLTRNIHILDLNTNRSTRSIDMSELLKRANAERVARGQGYLDYSECLNGIAYDSVKDVFYVTGKNWPLVFKVKFPAEYYKKSM